MEPDMPSRVSIDSVMSILSDYSDEGPKDREVTHRLTRDARLVVRAHAKGFFVKNNRIAVDGILVALMDYAVDERGQRYVATAILACKHYKTSAERTGFLVTLAEVWLTHLLFPGMIFIGFNNQPLTTFVVKAAGSKRKGAPSQEQTPTYNETATLIENATRGDQKALRLIVRIMSDSLNPSHAIPASSTSR
jgi:hypothetical protein